MDSGRGAGRGGEAGGAEEALRATEADAQSPTEPRDRLSSSDEAIRELARAPAIALEPPALPDSLAEYRIVRTLGQGGMGVVYLAHDENLDRLVALKLIAEAEPDEVTRSRFLTEARALARLQHPNIVAIHRVGEDDGRLFLVSEFLYGKSWDQLPRPAPIDDLSVLALGAARGLAAAHRAGVLHRDIKPANLFRTDEGEVKLIDFGLAKLWGSAPEVSRPGSGPPLVASPTATTAGTVVGTPAFLAPELWLQAPAAAASDVYALGVTLYLLLVGGLPHHADRLGELKRKVLEEDAPLVRSQRPEVPSPLAAIVDRCLRRDPLARYASAEELRQELEALVHASRHLPVPHGNPYRGLFAFEPEHRGLFFGRDREIGDVLDRLRTPFPVLVTGGSGAGKSSLIRAGVLPRVAAGALDPRGGRREWTVVTMTPGAAPLAALAASTAPLVELAAERLREDPSALARGLGDRRVLLFLDQAEELGLLADPEERARFLDVLRHLVASPRVRLLLTARSDFLGDLPVDLTRSVYVLEPLSEEGVRAAVVSPAAAHGFAFEAPADIEAMVGFMAGGRGSLPLLSFALAKLWEARDRERKVIPGEALGRLGGVAGALAVHADRTVDALPPAIAAMVPPIFLRLLTAQRTRVRRLRAELLDRPAALVDPALDALIGARLLTSDRGRIEVAHESLVVSWPRLAEWLDAADAARRIADRLEVAAAEWLRLGRPGDLLWRGRQLEETGRLGETPLAAAEKDFLAASRRAARRSRWRRAALLIAAPSLVLATLIGVQAVNARRAVAEADRHVRRGQIMLALARAGATVTAAFRDAALAAYDRQDDPGGIALWRPTRSLSETVDEAYDRVLQAVNEALGRVAGHAPAKRLGADLFADRMRLAERTLDASLAAHERQLRFYDDEGRYRPFLLGDGALSLDSEPSGARVTLVRVVDVDGDGRFDEVPVGDLGVTPIRRRPLPQGAYLAILEHPGYLTTRLSVLVSRQEDDHERVRLLPSGAIPEGFAYVPGGPAVVGSADPNAIEDSRLLPRHEVDVPGFLVGLREVTFADWLAYLDALPVAARRELLRTQSGILVEDKGEIVLRVEDRTARRGQRFHYLPDERGRAMESDWLRWPVVYLTPPMADAYARWAGARLCREDEWEKAARGADGRPYPHGSVLTPGDASQRTSYGEATSTARFLDEIGLFPASRTLYGADDTVGNAWEWTQTRAGERRVTKGGSYKSAERTLRAEFRFLVAESYLANDVGFRLCADLPQSAQ